MPEWCLKKEIINITQTPHISDSLQKLGFIKSDPSNIEIKITKNWYRSGAETYGLVFNIQTKSEIKYFFLKACCPTSCTISIDMITEQWITKRKIINNLKISVPQLYAYHSGLILEEFIPYHLTPKLLNTKNSNKIKNNIENIAKGLILAKFNPINPFGNLMSRGNDVVWVDFGSDLGMPDSKVITSDKILNEAILKLKELNL